jgi:hypothetical protein
MKQEFWPLCGRTDLEGANKTRKRQPRPRARNSVHVGLLPHAIKSKPCLWLVKLVLVIAFA